MLRLIWSILIVMIGAVGAGASLMFLAGIYTPALDRIAALCLLVFFIGAIVEAIIDMTRGVRDAE